MIELEKRRKQNREAARKFRLTDYGKSYIKSYNQLESTKKRHREFMRRKRKTLEGKEYSRVQSNKWRLANPDKTKEILRKTRLKKNYNLTLEEYNKLFNHQGFCCAICKSTHPKRKNGWCTDHHHKTGKVRGILCNSCNAAIGHLDDNPMLCYLIAEYLQRPITTSP